MLRYALRRLVQAVPVVILIMIGTFLLLKLAPGDTVDALVGDYLAGMSVKALAERYGIHRATVFAHLRRRNVPSRRPGLGIDEKAEAVRLARAGVSMRAIGRRMGVDRKAVRAALVEAGLIVDEASDDA